MIESIRQVSGLTERRFSDAPRASPRPQRRLARPSRADYNSWRRLVKRKGARSARGGAPRGTPPARRGAGRHSGASGTGGEHRGIVVPTIHIANSHAERRRAGGTPRGDLGRHAEMPEDPIDHRRLLDERDQAQAAAAPGAGQDVDPECARHERRPTLPADLPPSPRGQPHEPARRPTPSAPYRDHPLMPGTEPHQTATPPEGPARRNTGAG
jgi:hypothetical protein